MVVDIMLYHLNQMELLILGGGILMDKLDVPSNLSDVVSVSAGYYHTLALKSDGTVVGWGLDDYDTISGISNLSDIIAIDAGEHRHSLAITKQGTVKAWGYSPYGEVNVPLNLN